MKHGEIQFIPAQVRREMNKFTNETLLISDPSAQPLKDKARIIAEKLERGEIQFIRNDSLASWLSDRKVSIGGNDPAFPSKTSNERATCDNLNYFGIVSFCCFLKHLTCPAS